jgi:flagellar protein FlaF
MAGAIIIACAIGILMLVLVGYVLVGSTLTSADIIASAQKDMAMQKEEQIATAIQISNAQFTTMGDPLHKFTFNLQNTGNVPIGDFNSTDVFISISQGIPERYSFNGVVSGNTPGSNTSKTWGYMTITPDMIHPYMLDPGETMAVNITGYIITGSDPVAVVNVTTPNGITAVGRSP